MGSGDFSGSRLTGMRSALLMLRNPGLFELARFGRFGIIGVIATFAYFAIALAGVKVLDLPPTTSTIIGQVCSVIISYLGHRRFTFRVAGSHLSHVTRYALIAVPFGFALNFGITWLITSVLSAPAEVAFAVVMLVIPPSTYLVNLLIVFRPGRPPVPIPREDGHPQHPRF